MERTMRILLLVSCLVYSGAAWANDPVATASSSSVSKQHQAQTQDQRQKQRQSQRATGGVGNGGAGGSANQSVNVSGNGTGGGSSNGNGGIFLAVPPNPGMGECIKGFGVGGAGERVGGIISYAWHEETCKALREGQVFWANGLQDAAYGRWCQDDVLRRSIGGRCGGGEAPKASVRAAPYDWCGTRNAGDRDQHLECDRMRDGG